jgi:AcrR family transcriptional regulator
MSIAKEDRMPTPERTSLAEIVAAAADLLETGGPAAITMQAVAVRVGVKAPSLYKRVRDREALVALVMASAADDLLAAMSTAGRTLADIARGARRFAHERPQSFRLLFSSEADSDILARTSEPLLQAARSSVGEADHLEAARLITAWLVGFLTMELAGAFRLGGDLDTAFEYGLSRILAGLRS